MLLPPKVQGPISVLAKSVTVMGAVDGAMVQLLVNGVPAGTPAVATSLSVAVSLGGTVLAVGQQVSATQSKGAYTSAPWPFPEIVNAPPSAVTGLPAVVFLSGLHPCVDWVFMGGTVPGATVEIRHKGHRIGTEVAGGPNVSVPVRFPTPAAQNETLEAFQMFTPNGGAPIQGPTVPSMPLGLSPGGDPPTPMVQSPFECDLAVLVSGLQDGAGLIVKHNNEEFAGYPYVGTPVWANLVKPARGTDQFSVRQRSETCGRASGFSSPVGVNPALKLPTPVIIGPVCPNAQIVRVANLRPGATVEIGVESPQPGGISGVPIGQVRAWATECEFALPADWINLLTLPGPRVITAFQDNCDKGGSTAKHAVEPLPGLVGQPGMTKPVKCARLIAANTLTTGAIVFVTSDQADSPVLTGPVLVTASTMTIGLYRPLREGEHVQIKQTGCNVGSASASTKVDAFPGVAAPVVVSPVRIPHGGVKIRNLVVGARLNVYLNSILRAAVDVDAPEMFVPVVGLGSDVVVLARQAMCTEISGESNKEVAQLGEMKVTHAPSPITRTKPTSVTVTALDRETGQPVNGTVRIAAANVGTTGTAFAFTFPAGPPPASVVEAAKYVTTGITWNLVDPAPAPLAMLHLAIVNHTSGKLKITGVTWGVWKQELDGTFTLIGSPTGLSTTIHPPSNGQYHVHADVSVADGAGNTAIADFRGNAVVDGVSRLVVVWTNVDLTDNFHLVLETQTAIANGFPLTVYTPVVAPW